MFDENQLVEIKWSKKTKKHYESKGYVFTKYGDSFRVKAKDMLKGSKFKIVIICDYCGKPHYVSYGSYNNHEDKTIDVCPKCRGFKQWDKTKSERAKKYFDIIRKICEENGYILITKESEFKNVFMYIEYICPKHGIQKKCLDSMIRGKEKCFFCSYEERALNQMHSIEYVKSTIESFNNNKLLNPEDYIGVFEKNLSIECGECGDIYVTSFDSYIHKNCTRCHRCSKRESDGEFRIRKFLEKYEIYFEQEKKFEDCKAKKALPFDFYLPDYNLIVEFDGQNHYFDIGYGTHERTILYDKIKNQYCKDKNINLLRIPYWEGHNIESILTKELNL